MPQKTSNKLALQAATLAACPYQVFRSTALTYIPSFHFVMKKNKEAAPSIKDEYNRATPTSIAEEAKAGDAEDDNDCRRFSAETASDENPSLFRRPVLRSKNSCSVALSNDPSLHPGAFRIAGMNRRSRQNARHDIPAQPVPIGDASDFTDTFEEPVATLTAITVETPVMVDSGAVAVVLAESEEKEVTHPSRKWNFAWWSLIPVGAVVVVICTYFFLRPENQSVGLLIAPTLPPTPSPTMSSFPEQVGWLVQNNISDETALLDNDSPQAKAASWWTPESKYDESLQRYLLAVFYFAMGGERWEACGEGRSNCAVEGRPRNWLNQETSECDWIGVVCDATGAMIGLDFGKYHFVLNSSICQLSLTLPECFRYY